MKIKAMAVELFAQSRAIWNLVTKRYKFLTLC